MWLSTTQERYDMNWLLKLDHIFLWHFQNGAIDYQLPSFLYSLNGSFESIDDFYFMIVLLNINVTNHWNQIVWLNCASVAGLILGFLSPVLSCLVLSCSDPVRTPSPVFSPVQMKLWFINLRNSSQCFKSPLMPPAWGVTWNIGNLWLKFINNSFLLPTSACPVHMLHAVLLITGLIFQLLRLPSSLLSFHIPLFPLSYYNEAYNKIISTQTLFYIIKQRI